MSSDIQRVVVLRDEQRSRPTSPFGSGVRGGFGFGGAAAPPEPRIEVEEVDAAGRAELLRDPGVAAVTPEMPTKLVQPLAAPEAEAAATATAWGVGAVGADRSQFTGRGVVVSVLDTGIDAAHEAFRGVTIVQRDFSGDGDGDRQGHGTHCAGTVFGRTVGGERIGIGTGVSKALIGKVLRDDGRGSSGMAFKGIRWAADEGAQVISMSLGFDFAGLARELVDRGWPADLATSRALEGYRGNLRMFDTLMDMLRASEAFGPGTVLVAAAGNESRRDIDPNYEIAASLPAAADGVVSVGALGRGNGRGLSLAFFSNTLPLVSGPGVDIRSARPGGGTQVMSGTSMACPHVAGVAALWWEAAVAQRLPATGRTIVSKLLGTARTAPIDPAVEIADRGTGLVSAP